MGFTLTTSSPELAFAALAVLLMLAVVSIFILAYKLGYRNGESSKIASALEEILEERGEGSDSAKQRDAKR